MPRHFPLHRTAQPVQWIKEILRIHRAYVQSDAHQKAVAVSAQKTQAEQEAKRHAHAMRRQLEKARVVLRRVHELWASWHEMNSYERWLYYVYHWNELLFCSRNRCQVCTRFGNTGEGRGAFHLKSNANMLELGKLRQRPALGLHARQVMPKFTNCQYKFYFLNLYWL